jgi:Raf kinase inhibitor-like YbhB/YbcL family protein
VTDNPGMRRSAACVLWLAAVLAGGCGDSGDTVKGPPPQAAPTMQVESSAFDNGGTIPKRFTCDGDDTSPPLRIGGAPKDAKELALLVEDPDTRGGTFIHWSAWAIPPRTKAIPQGGLPSGARQGENSFGDTKYSGPCPPKGDDPHRYQFIVYALSKPLDLDEGAKPGEVRDAIAKRAIGRGETFGTYGR